MCTESSSKQVQTKLMLSNRYETSSKINRTLQKYIMLLTMPFFRSRKIHWTWIDVRMKCFRLYLPITLKKTLHRKRSCHFRKQKTDLKMCAFFLYIFLGILFAGFDAAKVHRNISLHFCQYLERVLDFVKRPIQIMVLHSWSSEKMTFVYE